MQITQFFTFAITYLLIKSLHNNQRMQVDLIISLQLIALF